MLLIAIGSLAHLNFNCYHQHAKEVSTLKRRRKVVVEYQIVVEYIFTDPQIKEIILISVTLLNRFFYDDRDFISKWLNGYNLNVLKIENV